MIEWQFTAQDVSRVRLAFSPLGELVLSLVVLRAPGRHSLHLPWVQRTRPRIASLDLVELFAMVPVQGPTADFLTPPPVSPLPDFADELEAIRRTPPDRVFADVAGIPGLPGTVARRIGDDPTAAVSRLADTLQAYWDLGFAEHWPRVRTLLEADVLWRASRLATGGARALFDDLHETVSWHGDRLFAADAYEYSGGISGEGLLLVPSTMCWPQVRKMVAPYQSAIMYPARGIATLWESGRPQTPGALDALLGRTRAAMLVALAEPISTTALARRIAITPGGVSQHLSILLGSGLAVRSRVGRSVLYRRTHTGDLLIASQPNPSPRSGSRPS